MDGKYVPWKFFIVGIAFCLSAHFCLPWLLVAWPITIGLYFLSCFIVTDLPFVFVWSCSVFVGAIIFTVSGLYYMKKKNQTDVWQ